MSLKQVVSICAFICSREKIALMDNLHPGSELWHSLNTHIHTHMHTHTPLLPCSRYLLVISALPSQVSGFCGWGLCTGQKVPAAWPAALLFGALCHGNGTEGEPSSQPTFREGVPAGTTNFQQLKKSKNVLQQKEFPLCVYICIHVYHFRQRHAGGS